MRSLRKKSSWSVLILSLVILAVSSIAALSTSQAKMTKDFTLDRDAMTKYILATVKAARTVYSQSVLRKVKASGMKASEDWVKEDHSVMLPAQYIKALGYEIQGYELSLVGTYPLYKSNEAKTPMEKEMLTRLASGKEKMVTFQDGTQFKGMSADFAISKGCADCHNQHPKTSKRDWKKGDFMGAIIIRMRG